MRFTLKNGCTMELVGRIDRVDKAESSKGLLLRIVDYKSSDKGLDLAEVYYGLALQMLTYLDLSITHSTDWLGMKASPAGVLYFHVHDPMIQASVPLGLDEIEKRFSKVQDERAAPGRPGSGQADGHHPGTRQVEYYQRRFEKDGSLRSDSDVVAEEDFHVLRRHIRRTFQQAGEEITDGKVSIEPYKLKDRTPCTYCSYRSFCQFDESLEENEYRILKPEKTA